MTLRLLGDLLLIFGWALPAIAAPVEYAFVRGDDGRRLGFRRTSLGKHLMAFMAAVAFLALLGVIKFVDDGPVWQSLRVVGFLALVFVTWWRWLVVHQAHVANEAEHRARIAAAEDAELDEARESDDAP